MATKRRPDAGAGTKRFPAGRSLASRAALPAAILLLSLLIFLLLQVENSGVDVFLVRYNRNDHQLKVTLQNPTQDSLYVQGRYGLVVKGTERQAVGDTVPFLLGPGELRTLRYDVEPVNEAALIVRSRILSGKEPDKLRAAADRPHIADIES